MDASKGQFEPLRISGLVKEDIGIPRDDGTPGSALYEVPFQLSATPPGEWATLFKQSWDRPREYTGMHRPGISEIVGSRIILRRTTLEEVQQYHKKTLIIAVEMANEAYVDLLQKQHAEQERERIRQESHRQKVATLADEIDFD